MAPKANDVPAPGPSVMAMAAGNPDAKGENLETVRGAVRDLARTASEMSAFMKNMTNHYNRAHGVLSDELARETEERIKGDLTIMSKLNLTVRKQNAEWLEVRGRDLPPPPPEGSERENISATFIKLVMDKFGVEVPQSEIADAFRLPTGAAIIARFNRFAEGSAYAALAFRPGNWDGLPQARGLDIKLDIRRAPEEKEIKKHNSTREVPG